MQSKQRVKQQGMTFLGIVIMLAALIFVAIIAAKLTPAYIEFMGVKKSLQYVANTPNFREMSEKDIRTAFDKSASTGYIEVVTGKDIVISKTDSGTEISVEYQVLKPIVANVSVLLDFSASAQK